MSKDGIQGFSKPCEPLALWAADKAHMPHDVRALLSALGIWFIPCLGSYKGETELSYLTKLADFWRIAGQLCRTQETVLRLGDMDSRSRRKAELLYLINGDLATRAPDDLGRMYSIPAHDATLHEGWTIPLQQPPMGEVLAYVCGHVDKFGNII